jgi:hypothetical protein
MSTSHLAAIAALTIGCSGPVITAHGAQVPVYLGPVTRVHSGATTQGVVVGNVSGNASVFATASSKTEQQGNVQVTTTTAYAESTPCAEFVSSVRSFGEGHTERAVQLTEVHAHSFIILTPTFAMRNDGIEVKGQVVSPTAIATQGVTHASR